MRIKKLSYTAPSRVAWVEGTDSCCSPDLRDCAGEPVVATVGLYLLLIQLESSEPLQIERMVAVTRLNYQKLLALFMDS